MTPRLFPQVFLEPRIFHDTFPFFAAPPPVKTPPPVSFESPLPFLSVPFLSHPQNLQTPLGRRLDTHDDEYFGVLFGQPVRNHQTWPRRQRWHSGRPRALWPRGDLQYSVSH